MCLLIAFFKKTPDYPLIIAANREELYSRPSTTPHLVIQEPQIWAGMDQKAGGTWLGANQFGLVVGITNRSTKSLNPSLRSRGLLCLDILKENSAKNADIKLSQITGNTRFNPFNLFYADRNTAYLALYDGELLSQEIEPGIHMVTSSEFDQPILEKMNHVQELIDILPGQFDDQYLSDLMNLLKNHSSDPPTKYSICSHAGEAGTVSSSIIAIHDKFPEYSHFYHTDGPPCRTAFKDYSRLFHGEEIHAK